MDTMQLMTKLLELARARQGGAAKLARDTKVSPSHMSRILRHEKGVSVLVARRLLEIFPSLSLDDLPSPNAPKAKKRQKSVRAGRTR
jgi:AraC-like DNA-binding protein